MSSFFPPPIVRDSTKDKSIEENEYAEIAPFKKEVLCADKNTAGKYQDFSLYSYCCVLIIISGLVPIVILPWHNHKFAFILALISPVTILFRVGNSNSTLIFWFGVHMLSIIFSLFTVVLVKFNICSNVCNLPKFVRKVVKIWTICGLLSLVLYVLYTYYTDVLELSTLISLGVLLLIANVIGDSGGGGGATYRSEDIAPRDNCKAPVQAKKQIASAMQTGYNIVKAYDDTGRCILQRNGILRGYTADTISVKDLESNRVHTYDVNGKHLGQHMEY